MDYFKEIIERLQHKKTVFLTGGAGVGKTTVTKKIIAYYEDEAKKVAKLASTGMAATLIDGQTLHSFLDLGIASCISELGGKTEISKKVKKLVGSMELIVIDEISMVGEALFDMIAFRLNQAGFRGSLLVVGDFLQLPPVTRGGAEVRFAFESQSWKEFGFETFELSKIYRTDDEAFIELLLKIRIGRVDEDVYGSLESFIKPPDSETSAQTFLFGKNESASRHNKLQLLHVPGDIFVKEAQIVRHKKEASEQEILRFINDAGVESELELKVGARVLFTRNSWNYFNGESGEVVHVEDEFVHVRKKNAAVVKLERVSQSKSKWIEKSINGKKEVVEEALFSIYQFPLKLAYAITIHKSQGMSIEELSIDTSEIFAPSQFYAAISRSSDPKRLRLSAPKRRWNDIVYVNKKAAAFYRNMSSSIS